MPDKTSRPATSNKTSASPTTSRTSSTKSAKNPWMIATVVLAIALIASLFYSVGGNGDTDFQPVSENQAATSLVNFVNEIYGPQIGQSTLKTVAEKNGLYEVVVTVDNNGQLVDQTVFITKDAKLFIPQAVDIADVRAQFDAFQQDGGAIDVNGGATVPSDDINPAPGDNIEVGGPNDTTTETETE